MAIEIWGWSISDYCWYDQVLKTSWWTTVETTTSKTLPLVQLEGYRKTLRNLVWPKISTWAWVRISLISQETVQGKRDDSEEDDTWWR